MTIAQTHLEARDAHDTEGERVHRVRVRLAAMDLGGSGNWRVRNSGTGGIGGLHVYK